MNKKIKDLLPNPLAVDYQLSPPCDLYSDKEMEKFAVRIINECAHIAVLPDVVYTNEVGDLQGAFNAGRTEASIKIQEHFGIEE